MDYCTSTDCWHTIILHLLGFYGSLCFCTPFLIYMLSCTHTKLSFVSYVPAKGKAFLNIDFILMRTSENLQLIKSELCLWLCVCVCVWWKWKCGIYQEESKTFFSLVILTATERVNPITPCFEAEYTGWYATGHSPSMVKRKSEF